MTEVNILIEDVASTDASKVIKVVSVSGQLDESNIDEKSQIIYQLITQTPKGLNLIFDFEKLEYMNSKSIGYLTDWYGKITEGGGQIVIIKAKPNIIDILQVIGLTQLITMYGSLDEAKFAIMNAAGAPATPVAPQPVISTNTPVAANVPAPLETPVVAAAPAPVTPAPVSTPAPVQTPTQASTPTAPTPVPPAPTSVEPVVAPAPVTPSAPPQS